MSSKFKSWLKKNLIDFYWDLQLPYLSNKIPNQLPNSLLFVCKGNICRSPFAEFLAKKFALQHDLNHMMISSAGLHVPNPKSPPVESITAAEKFELDLSQHRSQGLDERLVHDFNMIFVMEPSQLGILCRWFPEARKKSWLLSVFEDKDHKLNRYASRHIIPDPFGKSQSDFDNCFKRIEHCVARLFQLST